MHHIQVMMALHCQLLISDFTKSYELAFITYNIIQIYGDSIVTFPNYTIVNNSIINFGDKITHVCKLGGHVLCILSGCSDTIGISSPLRISFGTSLTEV